ncbi:unnamed protein product, partial [Heterobilharzia americana]
MVVDSTKTLVLSSFWLTGDHVFWHGLRDAVTTSAVRDRTHKTSSRRGLKATRPTIFNAEDSILIQIPSRVLWLFKFLK